jgi:sortase A
VTTADPVAASARSGRRHRLRRNVGTAFLVLGVLVLAWTFVVWRWNDPFTSLYTRWQQHKLAHQYASLVSHYHAHAAPPPRATLAERERAVEVDARRFRAYATQGEAIGKIVVPRLGLHMVLVNGTDHDSLTRGPGRDLLTYMPGEGELVYIAGHRTTYLAPFAHIDAMRPGDSITLQMPYGTFRYVVTGHQIVDAHALWVLRTHHHEVVALQACHPRFFATHRYIVWAKPVLVTPRNGRAYNPNA